ncbi:hypothetical protein TthHB5008_08810 [Thermus thermophilus]|uniref:DUF4258 domain-containing protein n=1 Tax=Thermus thermophilus TaxID=274 RepID=UPI001AF6B27F|nr:hypothetical protein TthHB5002_08830 [Thermus thermophilus]BCQ00111.1 hypothetical protein TthHB5008_08810 [Thermus thermophilus]
MDCSGFDWSQADIQDWEVECIRQAAAQGQYLITKHAFQRMRERGISSHDVRNVLLNGTPVSKDLPHVNPRRAPGINIEGDLQDGRRIRVKISWQEKYAVITAHEVEVKP